jgi:hypothetical protein
MHLFGCENALSSLGSDPAVSSITSVGETTLTGCLYNGFQFLMFHLLQVRQYQE